MRKYAIAGLGAVAAFSMSAFASTLVVDGGVLQAGADDTLKCTNGTAKISYDTNADNDGTWVGKVFVTFPNDSCNGKYLVLTGQRANHQAYFNANLEVSGDTATFDPTDGLIRAAELERVLVTVRDKNATDVPGWWNVDSTVHNP